jgi:transcriptional regulator with XRE-family HTH domain
VLPSTSMDKQEEEARRLVGLLRRLVTLSGRSMRSLEAEIGLRSSLLGKILSGTIRPQLVHVLKICEGVGLSPVEFFEIAYPYPRKGAVRSALGRELAQEVSGGEGMDTGRRPQAQDDLDERVRQSLQRLLDELWRKPA